MTQTDSCPDLDLLDQLAEGSLPIELESRLINHLDVCDDCRENLDCQADLAIASELPSLQHSARDSPLLQATLAKVKSEQDPWTLPRRAASDEEADRREALHWTRDGFELIEVIGRGGMGIVFKAREVSLDRIVAIKVLSPLYGADDLARQRFLREARAAAGIQHANVVTIYAVAETSRLPYLVMEFVNGQSLQERIDELQRLEPGEVARIGQQIAAGLAAAHAQGVIHRDVKPANILIDAASGNAKLSDFGLAQVVGQSSLTRTGMLVGTPDFIAPELLDDTRQPDHRADLFSLGSVLYAMCCGQPPFEAKSLLATLQRISLAQPTPISQLAPAVPAWLARVINRLHAQNPDDRIQSAADVERALQAGSASRALIPDPSPPPIAPAIVVTASTRHWRRNVTSRRSWRFVALAMAILAALFVLALPLVVRDPDGLIAVRANGETLDTYESLEEALAQAPDESQIEIRADGPFELGQTILHQDTVTIAAGPGFRPVIRFVPDDPTDETALFTIEGELRLQGLELRYEVNDPEAEGGFLVHVEEGRFHADRCRFFVTPVGRCLVTELAGEVVLTGCELHAAEGCAMELFAEEGSQTQLENCTVSGRVGIQLTAAGSCELAMRRCTVVALKAFELQSEEEDWEQESHLQVTALNNLFKSRDGLIAIPQATISADQFSAVIAWEGGTNVYSGPFVVLDEDESEVLPSWGRDFDDWRALSRETGSASVSEPFTIDDDELWDAVLEGIDEPNAFVRRFK